MRIELDDSYTLVSDSCCYWIETEIAPKDRKPYARRVSGYSSTLDRAIESFVEMEIRSSEAETVSALSKDVKKVLKTVKGWKKALTTGDKDGGNDSKE